MKTQNNNYTANSNETTAVPTKAELYFELIDAEMTLDRIEAREGRLRAGKVPAGQNSAKLLSVLRTRKRRLMWKADAIVNLLGQHYGVVPANAAGTGKNSSASVITLPVAVTPKSAA